MAQTKTINSLPAKTTPVDTDIAAIGNTGTANMRKVTLLSIANYILNKLPVKGVKVNGQSVVSEGVANISISGLSFSDAQGDGNIVITVTGGS